MQKTLQLLSIYIIVVGVIFSLFINVNSRASSQLTVTKSELAGVEYLKKIYTLSINIATYIESIETEQGEEAERFFLAELYKNVEDIHLSLDKYPQFSNPDILNRLNDIKNPQLKTKDYYDLLDYLNHENYAIGDVSRLLFEEDRTLYFLSSLATHYMPEYLISILIVHNKVEELNVKGKLSLSAETLYTEQNKLLDLSTAEVSGIIELLSSYEKRHKLLSLITQTTQTLNELQTYTGSFEQWEKDNNQLNSYIQESYKLLDLAKQLYDENFYLLESSLQERERSLNQKILYNQLSFLILFVLISLVTFYYYRSLVSNQKKDEEIQKANDTLDKMVIYSRTDKHGNITHASQALEELSQYKKEELIGKTHSIFRHPDMTDELFKDLWETILEKKEWKGEIKNQKKDGSSYWVKMHITPDLDKQDNILGFSAYREEISDKKQLEEEKHKTQKALEFKSMFLSNMSHEIRTPLNGIIGFTSLVQKTEVTSQQQDLLEKVNSASKHLLGVINDILDISKIESGKMTIEHVPFNLQECIDNVQGFIEHKVQEKQLGFEVELVNLTNLNVIGDELRFSQILTNLVSNAIKFTEEGSISIRVKRTDDEGFVFEVIDTGIGLKEEQLSSLFVEFTQADMSTSRKFGGTGLGLAISKKLVELMGGRISVTSVYEQGSCFSFSVPFILDTESKVEDKDTELDSTDLENRVNALKDKHILVAEDNKMNQMLLEMLLENSTLDLDFAADGKIALEKFKTSQYDLILMDIQMPNMNGYEASTQIRALDKDIPIIALSANVMQEDIEKSLDAGMNDHLAKPIEIDKLYMTLLNYLD